VLEVVAEFLGRGEVIDRQALHAGIDIGHSIAEQVADMSSSPHGGGGWAPGGGGTAYGFMAANIWPMKHSGV